MKRRKKIGLLTALPERLHSKRTIAGILNQCGKYGYDLCVFGAMGYPDFFMESYNRGESNILELADLDNLDGIIIDTAQLLVDFNGDIISRLCDRLKAKPELPAVALEVPIEGLPMIPNCDENILREMCRHVIEVHGKKKICIITGHKGNESAEFRLRIFLDEIAKHGLTVAQEHIVYGNFWYDSGDDLAEKILSGAISMPEAVICGSDYMALGLISRLSRNGIRIPEDMIVIGFDATDEAANSKITLTSYEANDANSAADAVDYIRRIIEPGAEILPYKADTLKSFNPAMSCGCEPDYRRSARLSRNSLYLQSRNYRDPETMDHVDIGLLMESYVLESFTASQTPEECMEKIYNNTYLIYPFKNYYLCLTENWLDIDQGRTDGYPDKMRVVVATSSVGDPSFHKEEGVLFDTKQMIPKLWEENEEPSVFYFSPVHFDGKLLGYSVIQRDIRDTYQLNLVHRNWLRFVNNALEMIRNKKRLQMLSVRDELTGVYNRRGMNAVVQQMLAEADVGSSLFVCVIDMDRLKYVNDTFGHAEGDLCIKLISSIVTDIAQNDEICVRAGGDEFYLIGVGLYTHEDMQKRIELFIRLMDSKGAAGDRPYRVTASIGAALQKIDSGIKVEDVIRQADKEMYENKIKKKNQKN